MKIAKRLLREDSNDLNLERKKMSFPNLKTGLSGIDITNYKAIMAPNKSTTHWKVL